MTHAIAWFRRDLRLQDNPAWASATAQADQVTAIFVLDARLMATGSPLRQALLLAHLRALDDELQTTGGRLHVAHGKASDVVPALATELAADRVIWNSDVTPFAATRDAAVAAALGDRAETHWGTLTHPPGTVLTGKGTLSLVFTPFYKRWIDTPWDPWPATAEATITDDPGDGLPSLDARPPHAGGEAAAHDRLHDFEHKVEDYPTDRDRPGVDGTSELSSDLRFGTLSPRQVATAIGDSTPARQAFVRQLAWRDWYANLLLENPTMPKHAMRPAYDSIRWLNDDQEFAAWSAGRTGYPIVDAGIRQLLETGWMHNRVRMIVGSFLVKDLLIDWRWGEKFFRHHLIDADVSQNVGNWQWVAGTGPDAAPYFRVFNPITQSRKFDPDADYIRRYVPELAALSNRAIHAPWEAAPLDLASAGVVLGDTYPAPLIDHAVARDRALAAYKAASTAYEDTAG